MWRKIILLLPLLALTGCFSEPTDEGCYKSIDDLTYDNDMLFNACKSKDKFIDVNSVFDYQSEGDEEVFVKNEFITEDEADIKNNKQRSHFDYDAKKLQIKNTLFDIAFDIKFLMITIAVGLILFAFSKKNNWSKTLSSIIFGLMVVFSVGNVLLNANLIETNLNRLSMYTGNFAYRLLATATIGETKIEQFSLRDSSVGEAHNDLMSIYNSNICLSNNQKGRLSNYELLDGNTFADEQEILGVYNDKSKIVLPQHQTGKGNVSIFTNKVGNYETVGKVSFRRCGYTSYKPKAYDVNFEDLMKNVGFNDALFKAISSKSFSSGWESIESEFTNIYDVKTQTSSDRLLQLLIAYLVEYKKSLVVGAYQFDNNELVSSNTDNLEHHLSVGDQIYKKLNKAVCVVDSARTKDSISKLKEFKDTLSSTIGTYDCIEFGDELKVANDKVYHEKHDTVEIEELVNTLQKESVELIEKEVATLAAQYAEIADFYISKVKEINDKEQRLIELLNEGQYSLGKLLNVNATDNAFYKDLFREVKYLGNSDYSSIYPYYAHRKYLQSHNKALYTIDFVDKFLPSNKSADTLLSSNTATIQIKENYNTDLSSSNDGDLDSSLKDKFSNVFEYSEQMSCANASSIDDCAASLVGYNGNRVWDQMSRNLLSSGGETYLWAMGGAVGGAITTSIAQKMIGASNADKKGGGTSIGGTEVLSLGLLWVGKGISVVSETALALSGGAMLIGSLMQLTTMIPEFIGQYAQITVALTLYNLPFVLVAILLSTIVTLGATGYNSITIKIINQCFEPIKLGVYALIMAYASFLILTILKNSLPYINKSVVSTIASDLPSSLQYLISIITAVFGVFIVLAVFYLSMRKIIEAIRSVEKIQQIADTMNGVIESVESSAKSAIGISLVSMFAGHQSRLDRQAKDEAKRQREKHNPEDED